PTYSGSIAEVEQTTLRCLDGCQARVPASQECLKNQQWRDTFYAKFNTICQHSSNEKVAGFCHLHLQPIFGSHSGPGSRLRGAVALWPYRWQQNIHDLK
ncbi:Hypothetical predicted protein, partial [Pelobates cultripes]